MKKYIKPAVELHNVASQNMMAVSFKVNNGDTTDQLARPKVWDIWDQDSDDED